MKRFHCGRCGHEVYFDSARCVGCGAWLGFEPGRFAMLAADPVHDAATDTSTIVWRDGDQTFTACANRNLSECNWLVPGDGAALCEACQHNHVIPDSSDGAAQLHWTRLEAAKRQLVYALIRWRLPRPTKRDDPQRGLAFAFLADTLRDDGTVENVLTGHAGGLITLAIKEGDDAEREVRRTALGEPFRTLIGHFRHEIAHYYWDCLVADGTDETRASVRAVFGDERADYGAALDHHYAHGPRPDWREHFISSYAAAHPWEDFAETFAHYAHMVDGLETANAFRLAADHELGPDPYVSGTEHDLLSAWIPLTLAVNALNRSMGQPDLYPFVVPGPVRDKLGVVHELVRGEH